MDTSFRTIHLRNGNTTKVSPQDYDALARHDWNENPGGYAISCRHGTPLHLLVLRRATGGRPLGMVGDHITRDRLDNRRINLRWVASGENARNRFIAPHVEPTHFAISPNVDQPLLGLAEAASLLGWDRRKLSVYRERGIIPEPIQTLASSPIWDTLAFRAFIERYRLECACYAACAIPSRLISEIPILRALHELPGDLPFGEALAIRGIVTPEQGQLLDSHLANPSPNAPLPAPPCSEEEYVGATEAAAILGWSRGKVSVYHGRGRMPKPAAELAAGPVWRLEDILRYQVEQVLGISVAALRQDRESTCRTYGLTTDQPIGAQLCAQGILSDGTAKWLDKQIGHLSE